MAFGLMEHISNVLGSPRKSVGIYHRKGRMVAVKITWSPLVKLGKGQYGGNSGMQLPGHSVSQSVSVSGPQSVSLPTQPLFSLTVSTRP